MIKVIAVAVLLLLSGPAFAQCIPYATVMAQASVIWSVPLGSFEGTEAQRILQHLKINDPGATLVEVSLDPNDGEVILIGFGGGCLRGHVTMPNRDAFDAAVKGTSS